LFLVVICTASHIQTTSPEAEKLIVIKLLHLHAHDEKETYTKVIALRYAV
jgi:hypothetical protein